MRSVNGYYLLIPKALSAISFSLSPMAYPALNTLFACALTMFVCVWVARTPLYLQGAWLLAAACLLVPTDPEVFGPGLYTLWWSSVLLFSLVFWKPGHSWLAARGAVLILAGLSTPLTFAVLPFLWVRAIAFWKQRDERILALLATACAIIQVAPALEAKTDGAESIGNFSTVIPKFLGYYAVRNIAPSAAWAAGLAVAALLVAAVILSRRKIFLGAIIGLWFVTVAMSGLRNDLAILDPVLAGPRYFFLPFILLSWALLQIGAESHLPKLMRWSACAMLAASLFNLLPVTTRFHSPMQWEDHLRSAAVFGHYDIPIHSDGSPEMMWYINLPQKSLQRALRADPFAKFGQKRSFPYRLVPHSERQQSIALIADSGALSHSEAWAKSTAGFSPSGLADSTSWVVFRPHPQRNKRAVWLWLQRGQAILLRQQGHIGMSIENMREEKFLRELPSRADWVILVFDHPDLPERFLLKFDEASQPSLTGPAIALHPDRPSNPPQSPP
jgi:hypothetical protein